MNINEKRISKFILKSREECLYIFAVIEGTAWIMKSYPCVLEQKYYEKCFQTIQIIAYNILHLGLNLNQMVSLLQDAYSLHSETWKHIQWMM